MHCAKSEYTYFGEEEINNWVKRSFVREYTPISSIVHGSPIEFNVPGADLMHLELGTSYIYLRAKITMANDANIAAALPVGPVNLTLHSLISNIDVELCGKVVSDPNGLYMYRAYLETLLTFPKDCMDTQLQNAIWYKDTAGHMQDFNVNNAATNIGFKNRAALFAESHEVEMVGRPHCDLFNVGVTMPSRCNLKLRLHLNKDSLVLKCLDGDAEQYKITITEARFMVPTEEVSAELAAKIEHGLQIQNIHIPMKRVTMKTLTVPRGQTTILHDNIYLGQIPERIVLGLLSDAAMSGGYHTNPFNFQHFNLNYLALYVNGEMVPSRPYQPNFANNHYIRDYLSLFEGTRTLFSDKSVDINRDEYAHGFTFWIFDLSPDHACGQCTAPPRNGNVRVELKFTAATTETVNVLCYAEFRTFIEIDKYRSLIAPNISI